MKKLVLFIVTMAFAVSLNAQDKVILKNGEMLNVNVTKNDETSIEFQYPNETLVNVKNKREIKKIIYASGREEEFGIVVPVINSPKDWKKVLVTYEESDVVGLTKVCDLKSVRIFWALSEYEECIDKLKKKAAKKGAGVILIHRQTNLLTAAIEEIVRVKATAYK